MIPRPSRNTQIVILVWYMRGCDHCSEFLPRFRAIAKEYRPHLRFVQIMELDAAAPSLQPLADHFGVQATPTTIAAHRSGGMIRIDGAESDAKIRELFERCRA